MNAKLISVIVPVYKVEKYLDECVQSIVNQTYRNLEIILVDDGSPDRCPEMCDEWSRKDARIKVIHKENGGLSSARNAGLDIATGDFIGFVDSDDYIEKNMYEILLKALLKNECGISCCNSIRVYADGITKGKESDIHRLYTVDSAVNSFFLGGNVSGAVWDKLYKSSLFSKIRFPVGETNEDYPLFIPLLVQADGIVHTGEQLYNYRVTEGSITHSTWNTDASIVLKHLYEMEEQIVQFGLIQNITAFCYFSAKMAYSTALHLDKNYDRINEKAKRNQMKYIRIMRRHCGQMIFSKHMKLKDKILYLMIVTRTLRPVYQILGRL